MENVEISYQKEFGRSFMLIRGSGKSPDFTVRMLLENEIRGIMPMRKSVLDGELSYVYDIGKGYSLEKYYSKREMEYDELANIVVSLSETAKRLEEYLLDPGRLCTGPETIFIDPETEEVSFCYYPEYRDENGEDLRRLAAFFLKKINHRDERSFSGGYGFFEAVNDGLTDYAELAKLFESAGPEEQEPPWDPDADESIFDKDEYAEDDPEDFLFEEEAAALPEYKEKKADGAGVMKIAVFAVPALAFAVAAGFMFSDRMNGLSVGIRVMCLVFLAAALGFVGFFFKGRVENR
ncbi:MAG: hypothetical protein IKR26_06720 [Lachnospiraceae bacterium]|nr:hypothetical protein [Lachnospiraceae bacterium]